MASRPSDQKEKELLQLKREKARNELQLVVTDYNVGVCGLSGTGKSSLINGIRGVQPGANNAAPVGVTECTDKIAKYDYNETSRLKLWDIPGAGTTTNPAEQYFDQKHLVVFDYLLIVIGFRLTEYDIYLAQQALKHEVKFSFVRSKSDHSIEELLAKMKGIGRQEEATEAEREATAKELKSLVNKDMENQFSSNKELDRLKGSSLYVVSAWAFLDNSLSQIDEKRLLEDLLEKSNAECKKH